MAILWLFYGHFMDIFPNNISDAFCHNVVNGGTHEVSQTRSVESFAIKMEYCTIKAEFIAAHQLVAPLLTTLLMFLCPCHNHALFFLLSRWMSANHHDFDGVHQRPISWRGHAHFDFWRFRQRTDEEVPSISGCVHPTGSSVSLLQRQRKIPTCIRSKLKKKPRPDTWCKTCAAGRS